MLKGIGVWGLYILKKPCLAVFLDPVLGCNLRCQMCYFSNEEVRKSRRGRLSEEDLPLIAKAFFPDALKLQIGCGAEPSLFRHNVEIILLAKQYKVPYISFTTNGNLLDSEDIRALLEAGLDEFTISLHGVNRSNYEYLMTGASYDKFISVLEILADLKQDFPNYKLRLNFTVNDLNIFELEKFFDVFGRFPIDILQMRPVQDIGGKVGEIACIETFNATFNRLSIMFKEECSMRGILYIAPGYLSSVKKLNKNSSILESTYCYLSPKHTWEDMDWRKETFRQFSKRTNYGWRLFRGIFSKKTFTGDKLNYELT
ncbi:MAG: radical SAM protein [Dysgonamonadaceae bacterium]|jgi:MoaA/NifB/PqqE/SkfB family radical SAM enzyme|nr:radical SAM protein [Dysgonamonadaceae bacterium]